MRKSSSFFFIAALLLGLGCNRGYISSEAMESGQIGPRNCEQTCSELGMQMGAFVMVQHSYAGCVCQPTRSAGGAAEVAGAAVQSGAVLAVGEARRREQQQQRRRQN